MENYKFEHYRVFPWYSLTEGKPTELSLGRYSRRFGWIKNQSFFAGVKPNSKGGKTVCIVLNTFGSEIFRTEAYCSMSDNFCYLVGRKIALGRAEKVIKEAEKMCGSHRHLAYIDGEVVPYKACSDNALTAYKKMNYIGKGTILAIDGVLQGGFHNYYFFI
jgi:hypothetical protein